MRKNEDTRMLTSCFCKINLFQVKYRVCLLSLFPSNVCLEKKKNLPTLQRVGMYPLEHLGSITQIV